MRSAMQHFGDMYATFLHHSGNIQATVMHPIQIVQNRSLVLSGVTTKPPVLKRSLRPMQCVQGDWLLMITGRICFDA